MSSKKGIRPSALPIITHRAGTLILTLKYVEKLRITQIAMERVMLSIRLKDRKSNKASTTDKSL